MSQLTLEDQKQWENWINKRCVEAGNYLVKRYLPLVNYHVQRISVNLPRNIAKDDLQSLGLFGLYDALEKFDQKRDLKFDTYASFRIRGAILDGLRKEDWRPRNIREKGKKLDIIIEQLEQKLLRKATSAEIAIAANMQEEEVIQLMNELFFANLLSIDEKKMDVDDKETKANSIKDDKTPTPDEELVKKEIIQEMMEAINHLNEKEQLVISLFYKEELTLTEIGEVLGLSTSRISQIHSKAIFKLKQLLEKKI